MNPTDIKAKVYKNEQKVVLQTSKQKYMKESRNHSNIKAMWTSSLLFFRRHFDVN